MNSPITTPDETVPRAARRSGRDIRFATQEITPAEAAQMLASAHAPHKDTRAIETYAQAMRHDAWVMNGQPIILDERGALIDGVQRLEACILADRPFTTLVARNVRADTLHTIDQHRRRNYAGVLESRGYENAGAVVRLLSKMIRIENGTLNREPLPVSWGHFDRVLERNPGLVTAVALSERYAGSILPASVRPAFFFQALQAGRGTALEHFMDVLAPEVRVERITAATQARMRLAGWMSDGALRIEPDKILGNVVDYFNAECRGETLPDNHVWNFDPGRVRNADGKWVVPERPVRQDRADNLDAREVEMVRGIRFASASELEEIALKLLLKGADMPDADKGADRDAEAETVSRRVPERLDQAAFDAFLTPVQSLRTRLEKEIERRLVERAAPPNLGLPLVEGYRGLTGGRLDRRRRVERFTGRLAAEVQAAARTPSDAVAVRMVTITPELARNWLAAPINSGNRKIQRTHVKAIARDIVNERWMVNAQPICFTGDPFEPADRDGLRLLNGQHRLQAVIEAGLPIEAPVAVNIPQAAFATFDVHAKRVVRSGGSRVDDRVLAAAARFQWKEDNNIRLLESSVSPTSSELLETLQRHPGLAKNFPRSRRAGMAKIGSAGVLTYFFYRVGSEAPDVAPQFLDDLEYGESLTGQNPAKQLREDLLSGQGRSTRKQTLARLLSGWNAYKTWARKARARQETDDLF
ncbi:hypothetical protein ACFSUD_08145 [Sulfitobacter aestuarii]|uniref:ParB/Sulfiredoxin domain-containing protein n=1 Tax=Sulfitobacter aestuarii TaxID=2161676 RepID=A0ABW5U157_9RHOB